MMIKDNKPKLALERSTTGAGLSESVAKPTNAQEIEELVKTMQTNIKNDPEHLSTYLAQYEQFYYDKLPKIPAAIIQRLFIVSFQPLKIKGDTRELKGMIQLMGTIDRGAIAGFTLIKFVNKLL